uniref:Uncharacterized protein n=1 Tax=Arundo donax TaxID=35708 RepID=A0A0A9F190_ARUDO
MRPLEGLGYILGLYTSACSDVMRDVLHYCSDSCYDNRRETQANSSMNAILLSRQMQLYTSNIHSEEVKMAGSTICRSN